MKRPEKVEKLRGRRKIIRAESEETQDDVREAKGMDQEEDEEMTFVPSAISVPQKPLFCCDNQCSEKDHKLLAVCVGGDKRRRGIAHDQLMQAMLQRVSGGKKVKNH